jgi:hypothetical protein
MLVGRVVHLEHRFRSVVSMKSLLWHTLIVLK